MKNQAVNMRDIKMILQKNDLLISSITRTKFGPYTVGTLKPGLISEADIDSRLKTYFFNYKKAQLMQKQEEMRKKIELIAADDSRKEFNLLEANRKVIDEKLLGESKKRVLSK